jgi:hypothetical protein
LKAVEKVPRPERKSQSHTRTDAPPLVRVSIGELVDKITILEIKAERLTDAAKLINIRHELGLLRAVWERCRVAVPAIDALAAALKKTNETLWAVEDDIRECEKQQDFGPRFVELARAVYRNNDQRAALKREINAISGSVIIEEKSYCTIAANPGVRT